MRYYLNNEKFTFERPGKRKSQAERTASAQDLRCVPGLFLEARRGTDQRRGTQDSVCDVIRK